MAKKLELIARPEKDPAMPGVIAYKAKLVDPATGDVQRVLGMMTIDEDDVKARGHNDVDAEVMAWATALRAKKEEAS